MSLVHTPPNKERSATHGCYVRLRAMILTGELPPGHKLKIEELRSLLNIGASPVREALSLLTSDLLVERMDQRGFRAATVSKSNFEEILALRCMLEEKALRASLAASDSAWEETLVLCHHRMKKAAQSDNSDFEYAHRAFHMALIANANMPMLAHYCAQLYDLNIRYRNLAARGPHYRTRSVQNEHQNILDATLTGDADLAVRLLIDHYRNTGNYLSSQMDK